MAFTSLDTNGDGRISSSEYSAYQSQRSMASPDATTNNPTPPVKRGFWSRMFHPEGKTASVTPSTSNSASARLNPMFDELDTNHDGYLSQAEMDAPGNMKK